MSVECQVNVKSQSELDIGGRETCMFLMHFARISARDDNQLFSHQRNIVTHP